MSTRTPEHTTTPSRGQRRRVVSWLLVAVAGLLTLGSWALASAPVSSPDDDYHLASIWCARGLDDSRCLEVPGNDNGRVVPALASGQGACFAFNLAQSGACQAPLGSSTPTVPTEHGNWGGAYPPVFYRFMATFVADDVATSVLVMRMAGGIVALGLCALLAASLPPPRRLLASVPLLVTSVPLGLSLFASTNPSSWTVVGVAVLFPAAYVAFETAGRRCWALSAIAVVAAVLAAGSRTDGCLFVAMTAALVLILRVRRLRDNPVPAVAAVGCIVIAALFFLTSGHSSEISGDLGTPTAPDLGVFDLVLRNLGGLPVLWTGGFGSGVMGGLGWLDTPLPPLVGFCATAAWFAVLLRGLGRPFPAKIVGLTLVGLALVVYPITLLVQTKALVGVVVQPRYLLPLFALFAVVALLSPHGVGWRISEGTFFLCVLALGTANSLALHVQIRRYVTGGDVSRIDLDAGREWWWAHAPSPNVVWLLGSLAFVGLAYAVLGQARDDGRTRRPLRPVRVSAARSSAG
jgi:Predicted membrane protein (DUF2142)